MKANPFLAVAAALLAAGSSHAASSGWPFYRGPLGNGSTPETVSTAAIKTPKELWKVPTTAGFSSFSIADGKAFTVVKRDADGVPTETVVALDAATGKELWAAPLKVAKYQGGGDEGESGNNGGDGPRSTPTYANGKVVVMGANLDLWCFDATSGKTAWQKDVVKDFGGQNIAWSNAASPLVEDGTVYFAGGGRGQSLVALNLSNGSVVWKTGDEKMTHATPTPATIHGVRQVIFFTQSGLVACDAKKGTELWRYKFPYRISTAASPIVYNDMVYCAAGYGVGMGCVKVSKDGFKFGVEELWRKDGDKVTNHWSTPVVKDGVLYGMFSFKKYGRGPLVALDMATGEVKWSEEGFGAGNLILSGGKTLVALSDKGEIVLVDATPDKYTELARADVLDGKCWSTPVLADGRLYARSTTEAVCLDVK